MYKKWWWCVMKLVINIRKQLEKVTIRSFWIKRLNENRNGLSNSLSQADTVRDLPEFIEKNRVKDQ